MNSSRQLRVSRKQRKKNLFARNRNRIRKIGRESATSKHKKEMKKTVQSRKLLVPSLAKLIGSLYFSLEYMQNKFFFVSAEIYIYASLQAQHTILQESEWDDVWCAHFHVVKAHWSLNLDTVTSWPWSPCPRSSMFTIFANWKMWKFSPVKRNDDDDCLCISKKFIKCIFLARRGETTSTIKRHLCCTKLFPRLLWEGKKFQNFCFWRRFDLFTSSPPSFSLSLPF